MDGIDICVWAVDGLFFVLLFFFVWIRLGTYSIPVYTPFSKPFFRGMSSLNCFWGEIVSNFEALFGWSRTFNLI